MPISGEHAFGRGMISRKAYNNMTNPKARGSASMGPKGKMVGFDSSRATDATSGMTGVPQTDKGGINRHDRQKMGRWKPSSGGQAKGSYQPTRNAIDGAPGQGKKFPSGSSVKRSNLGARNRGNSGGSDTNASYGKRGYYGGPASNSKG